MSAAGKAVTYQVAFYGPAGSGKATTLRALHALVGGDAPLAEIPEYSAGSKTTTRFFDRIVPGTRATVRWRAVSGYADIASQAFMALIHVDAVVFVYDARPAKAAANAAAWKAALAHFKMYKVAVGKLPLIIQVTHGTSPRAAKLAKAPVVETNPGRGAGLVELAQAVERAVLDGRATGRRTTAPSAAYVKRAKAIAAAATLAGDRAIEQMALHPELGFATTSSLASLEAMFFTYWNEANGKTVDAFWRAVAKKRLPFKRRIGRWSLG